MIVDDLFNMPKSNKSGECARCHGSVFKDRGYQTILPDTTDRVLFHVECFVRYVLPKYVAAGIIKD